MSDLEALRQHAILSRENSANAFSAFSSALQQSRELYEVYREAVAAEYKAVREYLRERDRGESNGTQV